jgi:methylated-DNA-[protein]-cysteine S-methyltransferase
MVANDKLTIFARQVYAVVRTIPRGKISTYQEVARVIGIRSSQAVGQALKRNPFAPEVPCHRVVKSNGEIGGFFGATQGQKIAEKIALLQSEGVEVQEGKIDMTKFHHAW